jgi:predicted RNA-binding protein YlxR (DUF448 family)
MTDEKVLCPDDGEVCLMTEEEKKGMGCWLCPKIQNLRETPYDKDADILKELRKNIITADDDISDLITEGETLKIEIEAVNNSIKDKQKRLKQITEVLKKHCMEQFRDGDKRVALTGEIYEWILSRSESTEIDKDALKKDGLLDKYSKPKVTYRFIQSLIKKEETA